MKIKSIRMTRGNVLIRRDDWQTKHESEVLDLDIPDMYQCQTWAGTVLAVGPPLYAYRLVEDEQINGPPKTRKRYIRRNGELVEVDHGIRKGMRVHCKFATPGSVELIINGVRHMMLPVEDAYGDLNILYAEEAA